MSWQDQLNDNPIPWLLEAGDPGVRYLTLRDLVALPQDDGEFVAARKMAHRAGPIAEILKEMNSGGYWSKPGPGYLPKYFSTVWSIISLAQLGAQVSEDERIQIACSYLMDNALTQNGQFSINGTSGGTVDCLQGNCCWSLVELGYADPRLEKAYEWMARSLTGEGVAPLAEKKNEVRYYAGKCGPNFACGANNKLPCAWGAAKVMLAFSRLPVTNRTPLIERAIQQGINFLFSVDLATADYPNGWSPKPSGNWWKFGFPVFYVTDLLQIAEALVGLGYGKDPRLANALKLILDKQDEQGRWLLEYDYTGKTWADYGAKKKPNKWVTLRALRVLKASAD
jgi:hypothetical protein